MTVAIRFIPIWVLNQAVNYIEDIEISGTGVLEVLGITNELKGLSPKR